MPQEIAPCGTVIAYKRHKRNGEDACADCKRAKRTYERERAAKARARVAEATDTSIELPEDTPDPEPEFPTASEEPFGAIDPAALAASLPSSEGDVEIPDGLRDLVAARAILWQSIRVAARTEPTRVNGLIRELRAVLTDIKGYQSSDSDEEEDPLNDFDDDGTVVRFTASEA